MAAVTLLVLLCFITIYGIVIVARGCAARTGLAKRRPAWVYCP